MRALSGVLLRTQSDGTLLALAAEGSEPAFEAIVQRYRRPLHAYCRRLLVSDARTEDIVQQSLLKAWEALRAGTEVREPRAWLYRITHNQTMSALRRPELDFAQLEESLQGAEAPEADLERRTLMRETLAAVAALPERQQEVILRTAVEGQSYEQVATALGLSSDAVRGLAHRARISLRSAMAAAVPTPIVVWAAGQAQRSAGLPAWMGILGSGGGASGAALMVKGATLLASTAAIVGGTVDGVIHIPFVAHASHPRIHRVPRPESRTTVRPAAATVAGARTVAHGTTVLAALARAPSATATAQVRYSRRPAVRTDSRTGSSATSVPARPAASQQTASQPDNRGSGGRAGGSSGPDLSGAGASTGGSDRGSAGAPGWAPAGPAPPGANRPQTAGGSLSDARQASAVQPTGSRPR
jgi:RNA polymerase sigma factor (sigma-70 family)